MLMGALLACMSGHNLSAWCPQRQKEGIRFPGNVVRDAFELPCGCREKNPVCLQEQTLLLTSEPSLDLLYTLVS